MKASAPPPPTAAATTIATATCNTQYIPRLRRYVRRWSWGCTFISIFKKFIFGEVKSYLSDRKKKKKKRKKICTHIIVLAIRQRMCSVSISKENHWNEGISSNNFRAKPTYVCMYVCMHEVWLLYAYIVYMINNSMHRVYSSRAASSTGTVIIISVFVFAFTSEPLLAKYHRPLGRISRLFFSTVGKLQTPSEAFIWEDPHHFHSCVPP